ncbi:3-ketoacyl-ACP reductase [Clostridia bacterium]|nr:3-ketoacyl-ACP reductase [Clostridia bacterium]
MSTALITGSARGIGAAIALRLAADGFDIALNSFSQEELDTAGAEIAGKIRALGVRCESFLGNVAESADCERICKAVKETFGTFDVLVNNAGITKDGLMLRMSDENYDSVIAVNQKGVFNMTKHAAAIMLKQKSGRIINIASVAGLYGNPGQMNYAASKGAVVAMTKTAAKELGSRGITVNAIAPGFIETPMTDKLTAEQKANMIRQISLGRYGKPEEVAGAAAFLAGKDSAYITGQVIEVSGGIAM